MNSTYMPDSNFHQKCAIKVKKHWFLVTSLCIEKSLKSMKPFNFFLLGLFVFMLPATIWGRNNYMFVDENGYKRLVPSSMESGSVDIKRQLQQAAVADKETDDELPPASGTEGHHTTDLETWAKQHPKPPY